MAVVETETHGQVLVVRMNRPERLNAMGAEMVQMMAGIFTDFRESKDLEVAIWEPKVIVLLLLKGNTKR